MMITHCVCVFVNTIEWWALSIEQNWSTAGRHMQTKMKNKCINGSIHFMHETVSIVCSRRARPTKEKQPTQNWLIPSISIGMKEYTCQPKIDHAKALVALTWKKKKNSSNRENGWIEKLNGITDLLLGQITLCALTVQWLMLTQVVNMWDHATGYHFR